ncbi:apoptosis regulatory protein Siva isoform X2 [Takifugu flavidus]|uniref:apoptosis regulatory protein Siva isoform X2 n=1 Tax=Takifugu flavidus TaxID=433684 RepID=UPI0025447C08|nr:apoptosis regulatory protein Siva isoform X2 [Takifugu flavidus]
MPKRTCPFPETFSSQYKMHIGQQELNNYGVFGSKYRQEIYEKTKNLLFNGAKTVVGKIWTSEERSGGHVETPPCQTLLRGQMLIGQDGKLLKSNPAQEIALLENHPRKHPQKSLRYDNLLCLSTYLDLGWAPWSGEMLLNESWWRELGHQVWFLDKLLFYILVQLRLD